MKKHKKFLTSLFIFLTILSTSWGVLAKPQPAQANWPVADFIARPSWETFQAATFPQISDIVKSFVLRFAYEDLMKWISGEKSGSPSFITNFDQWLFEQADIAASQYINVLLQDAYNYLCTGINPNTALYWKTEFDESRYKMPKCTLSEIRARFENPDTEWVDWQVSLQNSNNESGYLFESYEIAKKKYEDDQTKFILEAITGQGFVSKDKDGNIKTPGAVISGEVQASIQSIFNVPAESDAWVDVASPIIDAVVQGTIQRGINEFTNYANK